MVNKIEIHSDDIDIGNKMVNDAISKELSNMKEKGVWEVMGKNVEARSIPCKIFVKVKRNASGEVTKVKARMTAGGHKQGAMDESLTYSPTTSINVVMALCTAHAKRNSRFTVMDIGAAYLNADLNDEVYMKIDADIVEYMRKLKMVDEDHIRYNGSILVKLRKALYGTKQAGRAWFNRLDDDIKKLGYKPNEVELGVYSKIENEVITNITVYVDDILVMGKNEEEHNRIIQYLVDTYSDVTVSERFAKKFEYLGMNFSVNGKCVNVNMSGYLSKILEERVPTKGVETPHTCNLLCNRNIGILDDEGQKKLRSDVAKILYIAKRIRPDVLLATIVMASRVGKYNEDDKKKVARIFDYLFRTKDMELRLCDTSEGDEIVLNVYVDASYGTYEDGKGQTAYGIGIGEGMFYVKSNKQKCVAKSSTGAEVIALDDAVCDAVHLMNMLNSCGFKCGKCVVHEDNASAIKIIRGGIEVMQKTKFMRVRVAHLKEIIDVHGIEVKHCPTNNMIVDVLTKPIVGNKFKRLRNAMLGIGSLDED
jgi:hypothetical protein